jgi:type I pantothenate kinase
VIVTDAGKASSSPHISSYISFARDEWARLGASTPLTLSEADLARLRGINERVSLAEVSDIYLPLSRLLSLYVSASRDLHRATSTFLGGSAAKVPFIIGIAGSVAVGKSTTARILQALLARWPGHPRVDLVATDGFLYPNRVLEERGPLGRKGFPESYDVRRLIRFLADLKSGRTEVAAPVYSHLVYDIIPDQFQVVRQPDIIIVEGLNVLQTDSRPGPNVPLFDPRPGSTISASSSGSRRASTVFVSDFFDFSIYVDAEETFITRWYMERFLTLVKTAFRDPNSYFHRYASLSIEEAVTFAETIWQEINGPNLRENILPTRERARLILEKGSNHSVRSVRLRRL